MVVRHLEGGPWLEDVGQCGWALKLHFALDMSLVLSLLTDVSYLLFHPLCHDELNPLKL